MIQRGTPRTNIDYAKNMQDHQEAIEGRLSERLSITQRESRKQRRQENLSRKPPTKNGCKVMIPSLKEEDGGITTNRERILEIIMCRIPIGSCMRM